ncbi:MAG TPA: cardiolipin synthase [Burkholderiaceae bacterium]|nr:cardiolipin synthase [Burkholderiaceae bacterium]HQR69284.1 cardiolipin synthase [Burkholderiaceae bacterium]
MAELSSLQWGTIAIVADWAIRLVMLPIVPTRRSPEAAKGWLLLIFFLPWVGLVAYLLIGRPHLPRWRVERLQDFLARVEPLRGSLSQLPGIEPPPIPVVYEPSARLSTDLARLPNLGGNAVELLTDYRAILARVASDIDAARYSVHLCYYIFQADSSTQPVIEAMARAVQRGVRCRVLIDAFGSRPSIPSVIPQLRGLGIEAVVSLPFRWRKPERLDLRNHRKIVVIDGRIGYTGSQNMVSPDFKPGLTYSELVVRIEGPTAVQLQLVFGADWYAETQDFIGAAALQPVPAAGDCPAQILPNGPASSTQRAQRMVVNLVYAARRRIVITTPYFIPSQALQEALETAAQRGVEVHLIVDHRKDQFLVANAQRSYYESLLQAGVRIHAYHEAFLHTKAVSVDGEIAWVGSCNMDLRSFELNEEVIALFFSRDIAVRLQAIEEAYMRGSERVDLEAWRQRPFHEQLVQNLTRLVSPLL